MLETSNPPNWPEGLFRRKNMYICHHENKASGNHRSNEKEKKTSIWKCDMYACSIVVSCTPVSVSFHSPGTPGTELRGCCWPKATLAGKPESDRGHSFPACMPHRPVSKSRRPSRTKKKLWTCMQVASNSRWWWLLFGIVFANATCIAYAFWKRRVLKRFC
jgi:hypothetical protein